MKWLLVRTWPLNKSLGNYDFQLRIIIGAGNYLGLEWMPVDSDHILLEFHGISSFVFFSQPVTLANFSCKLHWEDSIKNNYTANA